MKTNHGAHRVLEYEKIDATPAEAFCFFLPFFSTPILLYCFILATCIVSAKPKKFPQNPIPEFPSVIKQKRYQIINLITNMV
jgi:hypothetical protein